jgi:hypothetical protein
MIVETVIDIFIIFEIWLHGLTNMIVCNRDAKFNSDFCKDFTKCYAPS